MSSKWIQIDRDEFYMVKDHFYGPHHFYHGPNNFRALPSLQFCKEQGNGMWAWQLCNEDGVGLDNSDGGAVIWP